MLQTRGACENAYLRTKKQMDAPMSIPIQSAYVYLRVVCACVCVVCVWCVLCVIPSSITSHTNNSHTHTHTLTIQKKYTHTHTLHIHNTHIHNTHTIHTHITHTHTHTHTSKSSTVHKSAKYYADLLKNPTLAVNESFVRSLRIDLGSRGKAFLLGFHEENALIPLLGFLSRPKYVCVYIYIYICVCMCVCMCVYVFVYVCVCMCMYMCVCVCVCMYVWQI